MKATITGVLLLTMAFCLAGGTAEAVRLDQPMQSPQICSSICSYKRLGIRSYVDACMQGCTLYQKTYYASGDRNSSLATCKAGCSTSSRNICEYGCNAAKRSFP